MFTTFGENTALSVEFFFLEQEWKYQINQRFLQYVCWRLDILQDSCKLEMQYNLDLTGPDLTIFFQFKVKILMVRMNLQLFLCWLILCLMIVLFYLAIIFMNFQQRLFYCYKNRELFFCVVYLWTDLWRWNIWCRWFSNISVIWHFYLEF